MKQNLSILTSYPFLILLLVASIYCLIILIKNDDLDIGTIMKLFLGGVSGIVFSLIYIFLKLFGKL